MFMLIILISFLITGCSGTSQNSESRFERVQKEIQDENQLQAIKFEDNILPLNNSYLEYSNSFINYYKSVSKDQVNPDNLYDFTSVALRYSDNFQDLALAYSKYVNTFKIPIFNEAVSLRKDEAHTLSQLFTQLANGTNTGDRVETHDALNNILRLLDGIEDLNQNDIKLVEHYKTK